MIVDAFLYAGESDMLELRLRTLADVVDVCVAVMSPVTHQGAPAPVWEWSQPLKVLRRTHEHLRWFDFPNPPAVASRGGVGTADYQVIERWHRDQCKEAARIVGAQPDDIVMVSDVDEIPDPALVVELDVFVDQTGWCVLQQRFHSTALDLLHPQQPWLGTCASRFEDLSPQAMRDARGDRRRVAECGPGGWHCSWFGTDQERQTKLDTFSHAELRGRFDPTAARVQHEHSNGEPLRRLTFVEMEHLSWPTPIIDGSFSVPKEWWVDAPMAYDEFVAEYGTDL